MTFWLLDQMQLNFDLCVLALLTLSDQIKQFFFVDLGFFDMT